jgi:hypothetical protein
MKLVKNILLIAGFIIFMALYFFGAWNGPQIKAIVPAGFLQCHIIFED